MTLLLKFDRHYAGYCYHHHSSIIRRIGKINYDSRRNVTLGILRETYNKWERRAPLSPHHVREILHEHNKHTISKVIVQPSTTRIFSDTEYLKAGAILQEDLSEADVILGVKKTNISEQAMRNKNLLLFAHVIKDWWHLESLLEWLE